MDICLVAVSYTDGLADLCKQLIRQDIKVVTGTVNAHACLTQHGIRHQHVVGGLTSEMVDRVSIVVGNLEHARDGLVAAGTAEQQGIYSLLRTCALDRGLVCLADPVFYPIAYREALGISSEKKAVLANYCLRYLSSVDSRLSRPVKEDVGDKVLVVGGGGREHAIAVKLSESKRVSHVYVSPGNGGTATGVACISNVPQADSSVGGLVELAVSLDVKMVCIGPEQPLVDGAADALRAAGIACFGPSALAARLEGSKAFSKDFMVRHGIPTAKYAAFTDANKAQAYIDSCDYEIVIKASGLAAGKGVVLPESKDEAKAAIRNMMIDREFGDAGGEVVIEERLEGQEISVLGFCDGTSVRLMPGAQDYKRAFVGDKGPNTGGMGAYSPTPVLTPVLKANIALGIMEKTLSGALADGFPFVGVLYAGVIVTAQGPKVLEFNCRFGDPETQVILPLLETDLYQVMVDCVEGCILSSAIQWSNDYCATVVLAAKGYPGAYEKGLTLNICCLEENPDVMVYHAGTRQIELGSVVTSGGRILTTSCKKQQLKQALECIYAAYTQLETKLADPLSVHYRTDIGDRVLKGPVKLGVLGSTRGTDLQYVIDAIHNGWLWASIEVVASNRSASYILTRAKEHGIKTKFHSIKGTNSRAEYDAKVTQTLQEHNVDLVLLIGYMRILSNEFVDEWMGKVLNVHPSLLPEFAGGMDMNVHQEVIDAKKTVTGCTVHLVTREVDSGPILVQQSCPVFPNDTADTLKERVQGLEGPAFVLAIYRSLVKN